MAVEIESKLVKKLKEKGFVAVTPLTTDKLPEQLAVLATKVARGEYRDLKFVSSEDVLSEGYSFNQDNRDHLDYVVYAKTDHIFIITAPIKTPSGHRMMTL